MLVPVTIREVMNETVETMAPDVPAIDVARFLQEKDIGSVVITSDDTPVGIVTESDLVRLLARERDPHDVTAADCMSETIVTIDADEPVERAVELFREHRIKKLPVLEDGDLVGIATTTDLSYYLPHLTREGRRDEPTGESHTRSRPDTAYENDEWTFESIGQHDERIDVGDMVRFSKTIDEDDVRAFADVSGDTNRLHLDAEYAAASRFGESIAHGTLVVGTISAALARLPGLVIYLSQDVSYRGPVPYGTRVTATCEVIEDLGNDRYRLTTIVHDENDGQVVDGEAVVIADDLPLTDD
jgi:acyl dehydratase/CBS domain-containing protein